MGWGRVVYMSWRDDDTRLAFICQAGIGLPAFPALVQAIRTDKDPSRPPIWNGLMAPPLSEYPRDRKSDRRRPDPEGILRGAAEEVRLHCRRTQSRPCELLRSGDRVYNVRRPANILAIYDAWVARVPGNQGRG